MKRLFVALATALFVVAPNGAQAAYPERVVKIIVPFAAGGATDVAARLLASELTRILEQQVVVENKPGAAGMIGIDAVAKSKPDGYTLGISTIGPTAITPYLDPNPSYLPSRHLDIISRINMVEFLLCARADLSAKTLPDLFALARTKPEAVTYGSVGIASLNQILHEELARRAGARMLHVPFNGEATAITAMLSGQIDIALITAATATPHIRSGKMLALAAGGPRRIEGHPLLPTIAEATGWTDYEAYSWTVLVAAKGTPPEIIHKLNATLNQILASPAIKQRMEALGLLVVPSSIADAEAFVASEAKKFETLVRLNNIKRE